MTIATVADTVHIGTAQVAAMFKVDPSTVRRWEEEGKLPPAQRGPAGVRRWNLAELQSYRSGLDRFDHSLDPCPRCGRRWLGMDAPVAVLVERAGWLLDEYGWISASLIQRRLRVTRLLAAYLEGELRDQGRLPVPEPEPSEEEREAKVAAAKLNRRTGAIAARLRRGNLKPLDWANLFVQYADLRGVVLGKRGPPRAFTLTVGALARELDVYEGKVYRRLRLVRNGASGG